MKMIVMIYYQNKIDSIDDEHDDSNEENKQQFFSSSQFPPRFHY